MRAVALIAVTCAVAPARAEDHGRVPIMIADGVCDALMASVFVPLPERASSAMFVAGLVTQLVAAPLIHGVDHEYGSDWGLAGLDFGARVALPVVGAFVGNALCPTPQHGEFLPCLGPLLGGGVVGVASAQLLDWLVISRVTHDAPATPRILSVGGHF